MLYLQQCQFEDSFVGLIFNLKTAKMQSSRFKNVAMR